MSTTNNNTTEAQDQVMAIIRPIIGCISALMIIAIIGNAAVIYIYGYILKNSTVHYFIVVLAVVDFVCCLLGFPLEIIEFNDSLNYPSEGLCKWQRILIFSCSIGSIIVLLLISIERYRKVCCYNRYQLNLLHAKYLTIAACFASLLLATPMAIFSHNREKEWEELGNITSCRLSNTYRKWPLIYFIGLCIFVAVTLATMMVLYTLLWRRAKGHFLQTDLRYQNRNAAERSTARRQLSRTNLTVILVTILFIVSFLPTVVLLSIFTSPSTSDMTYKQEIVFLMFVRFYILNSSLNPFVYGFCNKHFRNAFIKLVKKALCVSSEKIQRLSTVRLKNRRVSSSPDTQTSSSGENGIPLAPKGN